MLSLDARLLAALRSATVHLTSGDLAEQVDAPAEAVDSRLEELRGAGYDIESRPGFGYRLVATPDRLIADDIQAQLGPNSLVREILVFEETGSTNDLAAQFGRQEAAGGIAIFAERQTSGRGRFGRRWESASHRGLWFSLLLRPVFPLALWPRLTTWTAVAVAAAIDRFVSGSATIKWPNDVYLLGKKAAGILIETGTDHTQQHFAVVGVGVNVNQEHQEFPKELLSKATSLRVAAGKAVDRTALAASILQELASREPLLIDGFEGILAEAGKRSLLIGKWVRVRTGETLVEGVAEALDDQGQLLLRRADGELSHLSAGEVSLEAF